MSFIEYFYVPHSAYAYLGSSKFLEIAKAAKREIVHRPFNFEAVVAGSGSTPTRERTNEHRNYFFGREIQRWSEYRNAPVLEGMPSHHWNDVTQAACCIIAAQTLASADHLSHIFLEAHWRDNGDLADQALILELIKSAGLNPEEVMELANAPATRLQYEANTEEAISRSVFGSPTYFVDGDMFYGQDRLEMIERALIQPFRGKWPPDY